MIRIRMEESRQRINCTLADAFIVILPVICLSVITLFWKQNT